MNRQTIQRHIRMWTPTALWLCAAGLFLASCGDYVRDIENPISSINDEQLNTQQQVPFLIKGVQTQFSYTHPEMSLLSGALSDEMIFDGPGATFPQFSELDLGKISVSNPQIEEGIAYLGRLRLYADLLVERVSTKITFSDDALPLKEQALFTGYFYGGIARYWFGSYFGLSENQGGGAIDAGPFIPTTDMYRLAVEKFQEALKHTEDPYEQRVVNSLIARIYVIAGNYTEAEKFASQGMQEGDADFNSLYTSTDLGGNTIWYYYGGRGRAQLIPDARFAQYIADDASESARVLIEPSPQDPSFMIQARYPELASPIPLMTWHENALMLAEIELLGKQNAEAAAGYVNAVRASHSLSPIESLSRDKLIEERDKELSFTGNRLIDQRRFDLWHLSPDTWRYLPITQQERDANSNF